MAQTRKKRRRKHRGTQGGSIDRRRPQGRPRNRQEAKARAQRQTVDRRDRPPSWGSSVNRALIGGGIFFVILLALFGRPAGEAFGLAAVMTGIYVPLGYYVDRFFYRRRRAAETRARQARRGG